MTIKLHDLKPAPGSKTATTRVGRGEGSKGKTAGRGTKGTKARKNVPVTFEGGQMPIHMRLPKLKGFKNRFRTEYDVVNVGDLNRRSPRAAPSASTSWLPRAGSQERPGEGPRRRQADRQGRRHRAQVQRQRPREDHRRRRLAPPSCRFSRINTGAPARAGASCVVRQGAGPRRNARRVGAITLRLSDRGATDDSPPPQRPHRRCGAWCCLARRRRRRPARCGRDGRPAVRRRGGHLGHPDHTRRRPARGRPPDLRHATSGLAGNINPVPTVRGVVNTLENAGFSRGQAGGLMKAAVAVYCPQHGAVIGR